MFLINQTLRVSQDQKQKLKLMGDDTKIYENFGGNFQRWGGAK